MAISKLLLLFLNNAKSCAILKDSPSESRGVNNKYMNNNGFIIFRIIFKWNRSGYDKFVATFKML